MDWVTPSSTKSRACARTERCHDAIGSRHSCGRRRHTRTTCPSWAANLGQEWPTGLPTAQYASDSVWFSASSAGASTSRSICLARTDPFRRGTGFFGGAGIATVTSTFEITAQDTSPPAPPGHKELPPPARAAMLMGATTSSEFVAMASTARWTQLAFHDMLGSIYFLDALGACPTAMRGTPSTMKRPAMAVPPAALGHSHALRPRTARHLPSFVEAHAQRGGGLMPRETGDKIWI